MGAFMLDRMCIAGHNNVSHPILCAVRCIHIEFTARAPPMKFDEKSGAHTVDRPTGEADGKNKPFYNRKAIIGRAIFKMPVSSFVVRLRLLSIWQANYGKSQVFLISILCSERKCMATDIGFNFIIFMQINTAIEKRKAALFRPFCLVPSAVLSVSFALKRRRLLFSCIVE